MCKSLPSLTEVCKQGTCLLLPALIEFDYTNTYPRSSRFNVPSKTRVKDGRKNVPLFKRLNALNSVLQHDNTPFTKSILSTN